MAHLLELYHPSSNPTPHYTTTYPFISPSKNIGKLNGKVVLITGAGRGIGRASALAFAAAGASVACVSRTKPELDTLVEEITQKNENGSNPKAIAISGDVTDPAFAPLAVKETDGKLGPIDILVNNAGISRLTDLEHEKDVTAGWKVVEISLLGAMSFTQATIPGMIARKAGTIINVISVIGRIKLPYFSAYAAAKAGVIKYTENADLELRPKGIYTYAVHPCMSKDTTLGVGAINEDTMREVGDFQKFLGDFMESCTDRVDIAADTFVALSVEERAKVLSGRYVDATYDLEETIKLAEEEGDGK